MARHGFAQVLIHVRILRQNRQNVSMALRQLQDRLNQLQKALEAPDLSSLVSLLDQAKKVRDALGN